MIGVECFDHWARGRWRRGTVASAGTSRPPRPRSGGWAKAEMATSVTHPASIAVDNSRLMSAFLSATSRLFVFEQHAAKACPLVRQCTQPYLKGR